MKTPATKPAKGKTVRLPGRLHYLLKVRAAEKAVGINELAEQYIGQGLEQEAATAMLDGVVPSLGTASKES